MKKHKGIIQVVPVAERISLAFNSLEHLEAQVTYSSFISKDVLSGITDEAVLTQVVSMQSARDAVTVERICITEHTEESLLEVVGTLTNHLIEKGINDVLIFADTDEVDAYKKLGFTPIVYVPGMYQWFLKKNICKLNVIEQVK